MFTVIDTNITNNYLLPFIILFYFLHVVDVYAMLIWYFVEWRWSKHTNDVEDIWNGKWLVQHDDVVEFQIRGNDHGSVRCSFNGRLRVEKRTSRYLCTHECSVWFCCCDSLNKKWNDSFQKKNHTSQKMNEEERICP